MHDIIKKFLEADPSEIDIQRLGMFIGSIKGYNFINHQKYQEAIQQLEAKRSEVQKYQASIRRNVDEDRAKAQIEMSKNTIRNAPIVLTANGVKVPINKKALTATVKFSCGHEIEIPLNSFIPYSNPYRWGSNGVISSGMSCPECKKLKQLQIKRGHLRDTPIGSITWELHRLK